MPADSTKDPNVMAKLAVNPSFGYTLLQDDTDGDYFYLNTNIGLFQVSPHTASGWYRFATTKYFNPFVMGYTRVTVTAQPSTSNGPPPTASTWGLAVLGQNCYAK